MKLIEDVLNKDYTLNKTDEFKINIKINRYGGDEDNKAYMLISELKKRNINISRHIRLLLALEYDNANAFVITQNKSDTNYVPFSEDTVIHEAPLDDDIF